MTFEALTEKIKSLAAAKGGIGSSIKFATDAGNIFLTADGVVSNDDSAADCTIKVSQDDLESLMSGDLNPMTAFMFQSFSKLLGKQGSIYSPVSKAVNVRALISTGKEIIKTP